MQAEHTLERPVIYWRSTHFKVLLIVMMALRITSYLTVFTSSAALTQVTKVLLRTLLTGTSIVLYYWLRKKYDERYVRIEYDNFFAAGLYVAYLLLGTASLLWTSSVSHTALQLAMAWEGIVFAFLHFRLFVLYNALSGNHANYALVLSRGVCIVSMAFIIGMFVDPDNFFRDTHGGEVSRLGGYIVNPNELGMLVVLGSAASYVEMLRGKPKGFHIFNLIVCVTVLLLTQSRSSLGAFMLVTGIYILKSGNIKLQVLSVVGAIVVMPVLVQTIIVKQGDVEEVMSMTGRLPFWKDLLTDGFPRKPLLGYGFMRIANTERFHSIHSYPGKMTHNTFMQVLMNLGLVGAWIAFLQIAATIRAIIRSRDRHLKLMASMMLIPVMINSFTEFGIFGEINYGILFYHNLIFIFVIRASTKKQRYETTAFRRHPRLHQAFRVGVHARTGVRTVAGRTA
ncbi:MAG: O-antigen ligase family protein [Bacteroidetes bacterium]|nr:MAG: O-antigen ligase family protein [Bacteroidota bacterium]